MTEREGSSVSMAVSGGRPEGQERRTATLSLLKKNPFAFSLICINLVFAVQKWTVVSQKHHQTKKNPPFGGDCGISALCVLKKQDCCFNSFSVPPP